MQELGLSCKIRRHHWDRHVRCEESCTFSVFGDIRSPGGRPDHPLHMCSLPVVPGELTGLKDGPCPVPSRPGSGALWSSPLHIEIVPHVAEKGVILMCLPSHQPCPAPSWESLPTCLFPAPAQESYKSIEHQIRPHLNQNPRPHAGRSAGGSMGPLLRNPHPVSAGLGM